MKIFAPYWRSIAVSAVQDLFSRPQVVQQIAELLAVKVKDFLVSTQMYTVPYLVLRKRNDVLQRIAEASGTSVMALCREHTNLAGILASILLQCDGEVESLVVGLLSVASPEFANVDYAELLKSEPQATAAELLKQASEMDDADQPRAIAAIRLLADIISLKASSSRSSRRADSIGSFFQSHVLGIMALLADTINDGHGPQPILEKQRCLNAIRFMIKIGTVHVVNGLPQICACLRSATETPELLDAAIQAWCLMMRTLDPDDKSHLFGPTFALIIHHWSNFSIDLQKLAYETIGFLLKEHADTVVNIVHQLPSLAQLPMMSKYEKNLRTLRHQTSIKHRVDAFAERLQSENGLVVEAALQELVNFLRQHQSYIHDMATSDVPDTSFGGLCRALLDVAVSHGQTNAKIAELDACCLGEMGCLDPTRVEAARELKTILVLSNFSSTDDVKDFVIFFLEHVLVKAFLAAINSRSQGFLAFAMQELLVMGEFDPSIRHATHASNAQQRRWMELPESVRTILSPFLDSKYFVTAGVNQTLADYPLYQNGMTYAHWLRTFAFDLLKRAQGESSSLFSVLSRIIRFQDLSIARFILPYAVLNGLVSETSSSDLISREMLNVLTIQQSQHKDAVLACSQTLFEVLDYLSRWMQEKRKERDSVQHHGRNRAPSSSRMESLTLQISSVDSILTMIPANVIAARAVECKSYARALFHWEQYIRQDRQRQEQLGRTVDLDAYLQQLQAIYSQIDEPDGMEGISAHLQVVNVDQQILEHRKAGRWSAAQSWSELQLQDGSSDSQPRRDLLTSLRECGQYDMLLNQVVAWKDDSLEETLSFAVEAAWNSGRWADLEHFFRLAPVDSRDFNTRIAGVLLAMRSDSEAVPRLIRELRADQVRNLSSTNTTSIQECHGLMLRFHVLNEVEAVSQKSEIPLLDRRLDVIGPFFSNKQYILGLRRAAMRLTGWVCHISRNPLLAFPSELHHTNLSSL